MCWIHWLKFLFTPFDGQWSSGFTVTQKNKYKIIFLFWFCFHWYIGKKITGLDIFRCDLTLIWNYLKAYSVVLSTHGVRHFMVLSRPNKHLLYQRPKLHQYVLTLLPTSWNLKPYNCHCSTAVKVRVGCWDNYSSLTANYSGNKKTFTDQHQHLHLFPFIIFFSFWHGFVWINVLKCRILFT